MKVGTLTGLLDAAAGRAPDAPAWLDEAGGVSFAALAAAARRVAAGLAARGIGPGDRVALWLPNGAAVPVLAFALARLGATAVHLSTRVSARELAGLLDRARPAALAFGGGLPDPGAVLAEAADDLRGPLRLLIAAGEATGPVAGLSVVPLRTLEEGAERVTDDAVPDAAALTFTTSGTTGRPRLALHAQASVAGHARDVAAALRLGPGDVALVPVPLCGTFGMTLAMAALSAGAAVLAPGRADPAALARAIRERGVTHWVTGDDLLARVLDAAGEGGFEGVRFTGFAAFHPGAASMARRAAAAGLRPRALYGSSEVQALFAVAPEDRPFEAGGIPVGQGAAVAVSPDGTLAFSGPSLFSGYLGDATPAPRDGTFTSSDLGEAREGGGFAFLGRRDDALRLSGFLVQPAEIEAVLEAVPGVEAAVVVGAADGTRAVAFLRGGDPAAWSAASDAGLPRHKRPALLVPMETLPVAEGPNGAKLRRRDLRDRADRLLADGPAAITS